MVAVKEPEFSGNHDVSESLHSTDADILLLVGSACCIAAKRALTQLERKTTEIEDAFSSYFIAQDDYRFFAGFNQELIESGIGFIEEIHVFISYKPPQLASLLSRLQILCCPFPVTIFTPTSIHRLPSSASEFIDNLNSKAGHGLPVTISFPCSSPGGVGETVKSNGPGESKRQSGSENKKDKRQEEGDRPHDRPEDHGLDPGLDGDGGEESWMAEISFHVLADLLEPEADSPFQSLATTGKITITVWLCFF